VARALARRLLRLAAGGLTAVLALWGAAALWIDGPASRPLAGLLGAAFLAAVVVPLARVRLFLQACLWTLAPCAAVACWWLSIPARNDRDWQPDVARTATAEWRGNVVTVSDVRDFDYRAETDFAERWDTRRYDLDRVAGLDLFVSYWGPTLYAHTILSWDFEDSPPLAVSIETRKERGEAYSAILGFFRQFELVYVLADERDVVRLRTSYRGERVFLYRLATPPEGARALLPFAELRARSDVTERAKACGERADFSRCIREGLPAPAARRR